jgi:histidinol-phosphate phosphatase family protein
VPFLHYVIFNLARQGVVNIWLSVGYQRQKIQDALGDGSALGVAIRYVAEEAPLGTGGAIKLAARHFEHPFFALNGDTLFDCPLQRLVFALHSTNAQVALFLRAVDDAGRYGAVSLDAHTGDGPDAWGVIRSFGEKSVTGPGLINGGVYLLTPEFMRHIPQGVSSLENDVFPKVMAQRHLVGMPGAGFFLDMGLPESYEAAQTLLPAWRKARSKPFVLLDRDGTLIVEKNYLHDPAEVELIPGAAHALRLLREHGFGIALVTNQAGIGRGYYTEEDMANVNERLVALLRQEGVQLDAMYHCPHAPHDNCACRKPLPGMAWLASGDLGFDPASSFVIGDKRCDIELARNIGATGILVRTGYGAEEEQHLTLPAMHIADDLEKAVQWLTARPAKPKGCHAPY